MTTRLPEYCACEWCREYASPALVTTSFGAVRCRNCSDTLHGYSHCIICCCLLPCEWHHVGSRRHFPHLVIPLCINCHGIMSIWQYDWRRGSRRGLAEEEPLRFLRIGVADLLRLWRKRNRWVHPRMMRGVADSLLDAATRSTQQSKGE